MAFTSTITETSRGSSKKIRIGTGVSAGGSTGGDLDLGTSMAEFVLLQPKKATVTTTYAVVNESLPADVKPTIVTEANLTVQYFAICKV